ncbi:MAG: hypothetical protein K2J10_06815 [Muribaculaceae bacterium]|nr:hypothetical protein [Muribaculaceae bacterium]
MDTRYIVVLEIGSSNIKGLAASVGELGEINIIAIEETRVTNCVRYGKIQNVQEVSAHVNDIIRKLENNPLIAPRKITDVYVALGGRSLSTVTAQAQAKFPNAVEITPETIDRLKRDASFGLVTDKLNLDMVPHVFFVDKSEVKNVVGTIGNHIRAEFSAIVISPSIRNNLDRIKFDGRTIERHYVVRPTAVADLVLTASEKQLGCALVDFGAETTTITIYKGDVLQTIVTLPIGSRNITRDLMIGLSMTEDSAEMAKARTGSATPVDAATSSDIEINNYIVARAGEIVANILHQIEAAGFKPQSLPAGIILTGGGSRLRNFNRLMEAQSKMPVRMAAIDSSLQFKGSGFDRNTNIDLLAIAKYAAEKSTIDCLTPAPEPVVEPEPEPVASEPYPDPAARYGGRRVVDDDNLLEDDDDDFPARKSTSQPRQRPQRNNDYEEPDYESEYEDDYGHNGKSSIIDNFKKRITRFFSDSSGLDDDDMDEPTI